jgi:hypothetical protein
MELNLTFMKTSGRYFVIAGIGLLGIIWLGALGCQSMDESSSSDLVSVAITNRPLADVQSAVTAVFAKDGFGGGRTGPNQFTFTKPGSRLDEVAYGNSMFHESVTLKVVVTTEQQPAGSIVLGCNAWLVEAANDPVFQDAHKVRQLRKHPYEELLKEVQTQLGE